MTTMTDEEIHKAAKARVAFRIHLLVYACVNVFLAFVWLVTTGPRVPTLAPGTSYYWPIWPLLGWGLGLAIHGFVTYSGSAGWLQSEEAKLRARYHR